ncbi:hypothetical protein JM47_03435 [Ureaplasma diversum]|uniref:Uncharacterized protein n=1 Tax=Ureaplasma diversum TaxID=42094 RepID=A0A0C5S2D7_9BACT|nr:hypothetical protein [Ureaplasma diversum]AJQ45580.1 hypothetical protein JM47_03435 [Ureaplasma diversum]
MEKPKGMEADKPKPQQPAPSTPDQEGKNKDGKGQDTEPMPEPEVIDTSKPLLELKETSGNISLNPGSNEGRLTFKLDKQKYPENFENKFIVVKIKNIDNNSSILQGFQKLDDPENLVIPFAPIIENGKYKLESAAILEKKTDAREPKEVVQVIFKKADKEKTLIVKKATRKYDIPAGEENKSPVNIKLNTASDKFELNVETKDKKEKVNGVFLKFIILGLEKSKKVYSTPSYTPGEYSEVKDGKATITGIDFENNYKNAYDHIVVKIFGIFEDKDGHIKSTKYRFNYEDQNETIDSSNNLILFKDLTKDSSSR